MQILLLVLTQCCMCANLGDLMACCRACVFSVPQQWRCTGAVLWYQDVTVTVSADTVLYLCKPRRLDDIQRKCTSTVLLCQEAGVTVSAATVLYLCKPGQLESMVQD